MKTFRYLLLAALPLGLFAGCAEPAAPKNRFEKISTAYCECTAQLAALNREAQKAGPGQINNYFQKMQDAYGKAKECAATIIGQYGHLTAAELDSVNLLLHTQCPDLADKREQLQELLGE
ncbi:MAG: hypothetical protein JNK89_06155 [Saprospiraceae bacterium]|nr:hypothetical protein [Saprospiraceae bacterium]